MIARQLVASEADAFHALWLEGLRAYPEAFLLTEGEAMNVSLAQISSAMEAGTHWGVVQSDTIVAIASLRRMIPVQASHSAELGPFYVTPSVQGQGAARLLLDTVKNFARAQGVKQIELCVDVQNQRANALYEAAGFEVFGTRPRSVIVNGVARDDHLMLCLLD